jgi:CheY-like chemotaxis protein
MPQPLKVLLVEDNPDDAKMVLRELNRSGFEATVQRVDTEPAFVDCLHSDLDFILSDYNMPEFDGIRALELLKKSGLEIPFILVSGSIGEDIAVDAMKRGAADYLLKDRLTRLGPAVRRALLEVTTEPAPANGEAVH